MAGVPKLPQGYEAHGTALAVYATLCLRPMTRGELRRRLFISASAIQRSLKQLIANNVVVQQADKKYRVVVTLMLPKGTGPVFNPSNVQAAAPRPLATVGPDDAIGEANRPVMVPTPHKIPTYVSERAKALGERMRMPPSNTLGELSTGPLGKCSCGTATPFRYGSVNLCPLCSRK